MSLQRSALCFGSSARINNTYVCAISYPDEAARASCLRKSGTSKYYPPRVLEAQCSSPYQMSKYRTFSDDTGCISSLRA